MRLGEIRRWVFVRHSHPVSAWSRFLTTPLLLAPVWTRKVSVGIATVLSIVGSMAVTMFCWRRYAALHAAAQRHQHPA